LKTHNHQEAFMSAVPKLFLIAYHLWSCIFVAYHLAPGKLNLPNTSRSKVWQTRLDTNAAWTTWLWEII